MVTFSKKEPTHLIRSEDDGTKKLRKVPQDWEGNRYRPIYGFKLPRGRWLYILYFDFDDVVMYRVVDAKGIRSNFQWMPLFVAKGKREKGSAYILFEKRRYYFKYADWISEREKERRKKGWSMGG